ncbi:Mdm33 family-domain-containing protein [Zopfochytrium polystomum]|nr:Mdm33 family-domain-containing protein [Zopfochytrium polystomum]
MDQIRSKALGLVKALNGRLQTAIPRAAAAFNDITGYSQVEDRKTRVQQKNDALDQWRERLESAKKDYEQSIDDRRMVQRDINSLLQRKNEWVDSDLLRFTELYRKDITLEQKETAAKASYKQANDRFDRAHMDYLNEIRERYIDEQLYSDKIRRGSTYWTIGLISFHLIVFLGVNLRDPYKKRKELSTIVERVTAVIEEDRAKLRADLQLAASGAGGDGGGSGDAQTQGLLPTTPGAAPLPLSSSPPPPAGLWDNIDAAVDAKLLAGVGIGFSLSLVAFIVGSRM